MVAPPDHRDRLPPFLQWFCPDLVAVRQRIGLWVAENLPLLQQRLTRFGQASARGWKALDRAGRLFLICAVGFVLVTVLLPRATLLGFATAGLLVFAWQTRRWRALDRKNRSFVVCGSFASVVALVLAIGGLSHKPGDAAHSNAVIWPGCVGDETPLVRVKANPDMFLGKTIIIWGAVQLRNYYNYTYSDAKDTHYSLRLYEWGKNPGDYSGNEANLYLPRRLVVVSSISLSNARKNTEPACWSVCE